MVKNLERFRDSLVASFKSVLDGGKKATLIRIAHVGGTEEDSIVGVCEDHICSFIPTSGDVVTCLRHLKKEGVVILSLNKGSDLGKPMCLHADPLIFALKGGNKAILSLTYGENDVEPKYIWYKFVREKNWDTNNIDAYILFNSSFIVQDDIVIQLIHGGFKAAMWNPLGCFKASTPPKYCLTFPQVDEHLRDEVLERVQVNPHWIRGDYEGEDVDENNYILMILGDKEKENWFFSLPIAPPLLYFLAQRDKNKLDLSRRVIETRLGRNRERVSEVLKTYGLNDIPSDIRQLLDIFMMKSYYYGKPLDFIGAFRDEIEEIVEKDSRLFYKECYNGCSKKYKNKREIEICAKDCVELRTVLDLISQFHTTPQYRYRYRYGRINYSYLDFIVSRDFHDSCMKRAPNDGERYRCSIAWVFGLSLLVLLDSYIRFVKGDKS